MFAGLLLVVELLVVTVNDSVVVFVCVFNSVVLNLLGLLLLVCLACSLVVLWFDVLLVGLRLDLLFACFKFGV